MRPKVKRLIPESLRPAARRLYYLPADAVDAALGRRDELTPPRGLANVGGGDFQKIGSRFLARFIEVGGLSQDDRALDVGCGAGRMAVPLTNYLSEEASYAGFDVVAEEVEWCRRRISPRYPNFRFFRADLYNKEYNPKGRHHASEYRFPFADSSFDFVFLTSVFTHLLPEELENYLSEIARVLAPKGACFATFFLLNETSRRALKRGAGGIEFPHDHGRYRLKEKEVPEAAVAYDEEYVRTLHEENGLRIEEPIHFGAWSGLREGLEYQDVVVSRRA